MRLLPGDCRSFVCDPTFVCLVSWCHAYEKAPAAKPQRMHVKCGGRPVVASSFEFSLILST